MGKTLLQYSTAGRPKASRATDALPSVRITNYELQITNYESRITNHEVKSRESEVLL